MITNIQNPQVKPGDVFYTSWGYDQTNYDYVVVLEVSDTGKTCICKRSKITHPENPEYKDITTDAQIPNGEGFGDSFRLKIKIDIDGEPELIGSYPYCYDGKFDISTYTDNNGKQKTYKGSSRLGCFWRAEHGKIFYETNPQFGH